MERQKRKTEIELSAENKRVSGFDVRKWEFCWVYKLPVLIMMYKCGFRWVYKPPVLILMHKCVFCMVYRLPVLIMMRECGV